MPSRCVCVLCVSWRCQRPCAARPSTRLEMPGGCMQHISPGARLIMLWLAPHRPVKLLSKPLPPPSSLPAAQGLAHMKQMVALKPASLDSKLHQRLKMTVQKATQRADKVQSVWQLMSLCCCASPCWVSSGLQVPPAQSGLNLCRLVLAACRTHIELVN